jgi:hypothetical protein
MHTEPLLQLLQLLRRKFEGIGTGAPPGIVNAADQSWI